MTFNQEVDNSEIFIEIYEKNPHKIYIITSKQVFTIYSENPFTSDTSDFCNKTPEENESFSYTMEENVLISKIGDDVFKINFTDIKIKPCAQIIGEINYISVKICQVTIKTDVMVFEIKKGGSGGFEENINEGNIIGKTIAYWVKNPNAIDYGHPLYTFYDDYNEIIFEIYYEANDYSESEDSDSDSDDDFYDSKEYFDFDTYYNGDKDTIVTYSADKFSDEPTFGRVKYWKSEYGDIVIKTTHAIITFTGSMDDDGRISNCTPSIPNNFDNIIGEIIEEIEHVKRLEWHIITAEKRYKIKLDNEYEAPYTRYYLEYESNFFK